MDEVRKTVRETYGRIGATGASGPGCCAPTCCTPDGDVSTDARPAADVSRALGYSDEDMANVPEGSNLGLGCGNPQAIAALKPGETVLDLGSGGGFDCFLAAKQVGETGHVIGVDMTPEMLARARKNAADSGLSHVEFRLGEIEHLPVEDNTIDVILSNCVINLSPDKPAVFRDAFRVLSSGGRLAISDVVATSPLPESAKRDLKLVAGCLGGAALVDELQAMLKDAGFVDIRVNPKEESREVIRQWFPETGLESYVASATIEATKP